MDLLETESGVDPRRHWYYRSKARLLRAQIEKRRLDGALIWDVGSGSGFFAAYLLANSLAASAVCIDPNYTEENEALVAGKPLLYRRNPVGEPPDLVMLMDVLEHVDNPIGLLRDYVERARPGATFFITVPAHQWLWSDHDVFLGHYRRYTRGPMVDTASQAGLTVESCGYFFLSILPPVWAVRVRRRSQDPQSVAASDMRPAGAVMNTFLQGMLGLERRLVGLNPLAGVSVVLVGHRAGGPAV